jgi:hypothetical protein
MSTRFSVRFALFVAVSLVSACAGSVSTPVAVQALPSPLTAPPRVSDVSAEAQPGVTMASYDLERIVARVKGALATEVPQSVTVAGPAEGPRTMKIKLVFTQYDKGNAFARFMLAGLGQIHVDADVIFVDGTSGEQIGKYQISKQFAFGGIYGGSTSIEDVEEGFAKSVAEILKPKT